MRYRVISVLPMRQTLQPPPASRARTTASYAFAMNRTVQPVSGSPGGRLIARPPFSISRVCVKAVPPGFYMRCARLLRRPRPRTLSTSLVNPYRVPTVSGQPRRPLRSLAVLLVIGLTGDVKRLQARPGCLAGPAAARCPASARTHRWRHLRRGPPRASGGRRTSHPAQAVDG